MLYISIGLLSILIIWVFVLLLRAALFKPNSFFIPKETKVDLNKDVIVNNMQEMIRCKTVSYADKSMVNEEEFVKFQNLLPKLYPNIHSTCTRTFIGANGILYHWKGRESGNPTVLMSHYDVVPVDESQWEKDPFAGILEKDIIWGRGTLDTKGTLCAIMESAEHLMKEGFTPKNDIYFAFSGDEEISGSTCPTMVNWFKERNIQPAMVLDEGGAVVENVFPGVKSECALVGIGEKGFANIELHAKSNGGHASMPPTHTIVGDLSKAVVSIENNPFQREMVMPIEAMLDTLGRNSSFLYKILFANLWCFESLFDFICKKSGGEMNALMRTTCAVTKMEGSKAFNVIPPRASVGMNLRLMGSETVESARTYIEKTINNPNIEVSVWEGRNPSPSSDIKTNEWNYLCQSIADTWTESIVSPYLMLACSDSWHYSQISDRVYKFSAMKLSTEERGLIHGNNERVPVKTLIKAVEFYVRLIKNMS